MDLRQHPSDGKRPLLVPALAVAASLVLHGLVAAAPLVLDSPPPKRSRLLRFDVVRRPSRPPAPPRVEERPVKPPPPRHHPRHRPIPAKKLAAVDPAPKPQEGPPPPPVFGASAESVTDGDSSFAVPLGNTVATDPDNRGPLEPGKPAPAPPPPPPKPKPVTVRSKPRLLKEVRVAYPPKARELGIEGTVRVRVLVGRDGLVKQAQVLAGPGFGLNEAARRALERFRFQPAMGSDGKPMPYWIIYRYSFQVDD